MKVNQRWDKERGHIFEHGNAPTEGTIFYECTNCLHGPCRTIAHGHESIIAQKNYCPLSTPTRSNDRCSWKKVSIPVEIRSDLTTACHQLHREDYDRPDEAVVDHDIEFHDIARANVWYRCNSCGTYYTSWHDADKRLCYRCSRGDES